VRENDGHGLAGWERHARRRLTKPATRRHVAGEVSAPGNRQAIPAHIRPASRRATMAQTAADHPRQGHLARPDNGPHNGRGVVRHLARRVRHTPRLHDPAGAGAPSTHRLALRPDAALSRAPVTREGVDGETARRGLADSYVYALHARLASLLIASGADVKVVQARLRHASAKTTLDTYGHLWPDSDDSTRVAVAAGLANRRERTACGPTAD